MRHQAEDIAAFVANAVVASFDYPPPVVGVPAALWVVAPTAAPWAQGAVATPEPSPKRKGTGVLSWVFGLCAFGITDTAKTTGRLFGM